MDTPKRPIKRRKERRPQENSPVKTGMKPVHAILGGSSIIALSILLSGMWVLDKLERIEREVRYTEIHTKHSKSHLKYISDHTEYTSTSASDTVEELRDIERKLETIAQYISYSNDYLSDLRFR